MIYAILVHMAEKPRFYDNLLKDHFENHAKMILVSGPRQVGKTTACRSLADYYFNWDNWDDRRKILKGPASLAEAVEHTKLREKLPVVVLDELHKYIKWKSFLRDFLIPTRIVLK